MTERQTFTDEELVAYLDGEVEFTPADAITAALANDPVLAQRLATKPTSMTNCLIMRSFPFISRMRAGDFEEPLGRDRYLSGERKIPPRRCGTALKPPMRVCGAIALC